MMRNTRGQVTAEMAVLFSFVIAAFVFMGFYLQRGVQGSTKSNADQLGQQFSTESGWSSYSASDSHEAGANTKTGSCSKYVHDVSAGAGDPGVANCAPDDGASLTVVTPP